MVAQSILFLLDAAPLNWSTREEFHFRLSRALLARGVQPVLGYSAELPAAVGERLRTSGAKILTLNYREGRKAYFNRLGAAVKQFRVQAAHVRFFDYFS